MSDEKRNRAAPDRGKAGLGEGNEAMNRPKVPGSKAHWRAPYALLAPRQTKLRQELGKR